MPVYLLLLVIILGVVYAFYYRSRKNLREAKNYERGLKMVPLLIHLPPMSDDIEVGSRDVRDVTEENISRAQIMYNIIASTAKSGFKSKFYGQRHLSFEIIAAKGLVYYYAAVPVALVPVIEQAVVSAYPTARLEEVAEHNIFSPVGRVTGTNGGELSLKEPFAYPIATFQDLKRDAMQSLLNAFSNLSHEDGAGIQILLRPAAKSWVSKAISVAQKKKKDKGKKKGSSAFGSYAAQILSAPLKAPGEEEGKKSPEDKQLSSLEQSVVDAIEEKTRHPGYEVLVRLVVSSNTSQRSQTILNNLVASFSLFDAPGKNGFKFTAAKDMESFATAYIMRFFPPEANQNVLNSVELATIFHFPDQRNTPTSQVQRQASKQVDGPQDIPDDGLLLGYNVFRGIKKEIRLSKKDRQRHLYIIGQTGTGKSVLLENLALQDMLDGNGFAFIDPHGDTAESLLAMVPKERTEDVIYFSPSDMDYPLGLNLFEFSSPEQKDFLIQEAINMLYKLYDPQHQGIIGPRYEHWFRNAALTLMSDPQGSTFIDIPKVFTDNQYAKQKLAYVTDQTVLEFWNKEMAQTSDYHKSEVLGWFVSKFGAFLSNEMMRNIIGQTESSFDLRQIMDDKKILLVNLSKGKTGELNSKLLGMIFVMKFQAAAMSRANVPEAERTDFSLYVDEFQNFSTDSFATILAEARKYHLNLIVANQYIGQLTEEIRDAVFGNVGSIVSLRASATDADFLVKTFSPIFDTEDVVKLPNYNGIVRLMVGGVPSQPFSMATLPPLGNPNPKLAEALRQLSAAKYGRPRASVEEEIFRRLKTIETTPSLGARPAAGSLPPRQGALPPRPATQPAASSFLDDWLAKRKAGVPATPQGGAVRPLGARKSPRQQPAALSATPQPLARSQAPEQASVSPVKPASSPMPAPAPVAAVETSSAPTQAPIAPVPQQTRPGQPTSRPASLAPKSLEEIQQKEGLTGNVTIGPVVSESKVGDGEPRPEDEIYIDKDGNMHYSGDGQSQASS